MLESVKAFVNNIPFPHITATVGFVVSDIKKEPIPTQPVIIGNKVGDYVIPSYFDDVDVDDIQETTGQQSVQSIVKLIVDSQQRLMRLLDEYPELAEQIPPEQTEEMNKFCNYLDVDETVVSTVNIDEALMMEFKEEIS